MAVNDGGNVPAASDGVDPKEWWQELAKIDGGGVVSELYCHRVIRFVRVDSPPNNNGQQRPEMLAEYRKRFDGVFQGRAREVLLIRETKFHDHMGQPQLSGWDAIHSFTTRVGQE